MVTWAKERNHIILRGIDSLITAPNNGEPDYYLPQEKHFIEEKKTWKDKLKSNQFQQCSYLMGLGYTVSIAFRDTGKLVPFKEYMKWIKWPRSWKY